MVEISFKSGGEAKVKKKVKSQRLALNWNLMIYKHMLN